MNEIQLFTNDLFGSVRSIIGPDGEPWFVGSDVARCLGYIKPRNAIETHVKDKEKLLINISNFSTAPNQGGIPGNPNMIVISEFGVYSLIFSSKLPAAEQFTDWVKSILKLMRKIGIDRSEELLRNELDRIQLYCNQLEDTNRLLYKQNFAAGNLSLQNSSAKLDRDILLYNIINNPYLSTQDKVNIISYDPTTYNQNIDLEESINKFKQKYNL